MTERKAKLVAAAQAFIAVTSGGVLEQNYLWTDLRDALAAAAKEGCTMPDTDLADRLFGPDPDGTAGRWEIAGDDSTWDPEVPDA